MPLIYGSKFDTIKIPAGDVGSYKYYSAYVAPDTSDALSLFFTIFLSAIELAIGATGIGGIATSVLGVGFAGARAGATSAITGRDFD